jgi:hypothetical protein
MKKTKAAAPTPHSYSVLRQICNYIPEFLVPKLARATKVDKKARTFLPWSHVVALIYAQLTHAIGLNDVCDALGLNSGPLSALRGATAPTRNNLSHANWLPSRGRRVHERAAPVAAAVNRRKYHHCRRRACQPAR